MADPQDAIYVCDWCGEERTERQLRVFSNNHMNRKGRPECWGSFTEKEEYIFKKAEKQLDDSELQADIDWLLDWAKSGLYLASARQDEWGIFDDIKKRNQK